MFQYRFNREHDKAASYAILVGGIVSSLCVFVWALRQPGSFAPMSLVMFSVGPLLTLLGGMLLIFGGALELDFAPDCADPVARSQHELLRSLAIPQSGVLISKGFAYFVQLFSGFFCFISPSE